MWSLEKIWRIQFTENNNKQQNMLTETSVYSAIWNLDAESRSLLLANYKLGELYQIVSSQKDLAKCLEDYASNAILYINAMKAITQLRAEAMKESYVNRQENAVSTMETVYDGLPDSHKKDFCRRMVERNDFFQEAYKEIMGKFHSALRGQEEKVCSK